MSSYHESDYQCWRQVLRYLAILTERVHPLLRRPLASAIAQLRDIARDAEAWDDREGGAK